MADIWTTNRDLVQRLYQDERVPLKKLKTILVEEHGFPDLPLSKLDKKLREELGLRVKLKKGDWSRVYFYTQSKGYQRGYYDVLLNGTVIDPKKVWKEIRRSGALSSNQTAGQNCSLPHGVQVRPHKDNPNTIIERIFQPSQCHGSSKTLDSGRETAQPTQTWDRSSALTELLSLAQLWTNAELQNIINRVSIINIILESLPSNDFRITVLAHISLSFTHVPNNGFVPGFREMISFHIADSLHPPPWRPANNVETLGESPNQRYWSRTICILVHIISNQLSKDLHQTFEVLGIVLSQLTPGTVCDIFRDGCLSLRAVWDSLLRIINSRLKYRNKHRRSRQLLASNSLILPFKIFIAMNPDWTATAESISGIMSAGLGDIELTRKLLTCNSIRYPGSDDMNHLLLGAIQRAAQSDSFECIKHLVRYCFTNIRAELCVELSSYLLSNLLKSLANSLHYEDEKLAILRSLKILVNSGADPNAPFENENFTKLQRPLLSQIDWKLSALEVSYYLSNEAFRTMSNPIYPARAPEYMSRVSICLALEQGEAALDNYLQSLTMYSLEEKDKRLQSLLLEQFVFMEDPLGANFETHARIAKTLLEYGVRIPSSQFKRLWDRNVENKDNIDLMLEIWVGNVKQYGLSDNMRLIWNRLIKAQPVMSIGLSKVCVEATGVNILEILQESHMWENTDPGLRAGALLEATFQHNHEAVDWLLKHGVDINSEIYVDILEKRATIIGAYLEWDPMGSKSSTTMLQHLIEAGANLRYYKQDLECSSLMTAALRAPSLSQKRSLAVLHFFQGYPTEVACIPRQKWNEILQVFLESSSRRGDEQTDREYWKLFDRLVRQHFDSQSGPILIKAIKAGCGLKVAKTLKEYGANVNEEGGFCNNVTPLRSAVEIGDPDLVRWLHKQGAAVYISALCDACKLQCHTAKKQRDKMRCIEFMAENGADVNYRCQRLRINPLLACVATADVEAAAFLMKQQVDPNLAFYLYQEKFGSKIYYVQTALDQAAEHGRLDITQLLLKSGALSGRTGLTGYDGALRIAQEKRHSAVNELIRRHIITNENLFERSVTAKKSHQAVIDHARRSWYVEFEDRRARAHWCRGVAGRKYCKACEEVLQT